MNILKKKNKDAENIEFLEPAHEKVEEKVVDKNKYISLINVNKYYDKNVHAVVDFNLDIKKHEFVVFVGPSGCGKSTTLRMIAGLEEISSGELYINGEYANDLVPKDRDIAMVFQSYALYPNLTVYDNLAFSLKVRHFPKADIDERVHEAAKILEIEELLERKPKQLSGGQRQRVALGRAIVRKARLFLMDEPLSNLDAKLRVQMRSEIIKLHKKINTTTIYVTHDQTEAMTMADRIVVMKNGYVQQIGTPLDIYRHPSNVFVASFIGSPAMNFIDAKYDGKTLTFEDGLVINANEELIKKHDEFYKNILKEEQDSLPEFEDIYNKKVEILSKAKIKKGRVQKELDKLKEEYNLKHENIHKFEAIVNGEPHTVIFGIRPENIIETNKLGDLTYEKEIKLSELLGDEYYVHFDFGGKDILAKVSSEEEIAAGAKLKLKIVERKIHLFDSISKKTIC